MNFLEFFLPDFLSGNEPPPAPPEKTFTQEDVNRLLATNKRELQSKLEASLAKLNELEKVGDPLALKAKIEELSTSLMTKEEIAKKEQEKLQKKYEEDLVRQKTEAESWAQRYKQSRIKESIAQAAAQHNAYNAAQLEMLLAPTAKVVEKTDADGKGLGEFEVKLPVQVGDKVLELPASEAVAKMRENTAVFGNLFKIDSKSGFGGTLNTSPAPARDGQPPTDPEAFYAWLKNSK